MEWLAAASRRIGLESMQAKERNVKTAKYNESVRALALRCLLRWEQGGVFAETLVHREGSARTAADRALLQAMVMGTLRHYRRLDYMRAKLRESKLEPKGHWLVLLGLCQLFVLDVPEHAAVSETVEVAPARLRGVVNGMLRSALRRRREFAAELPTLPLGVRFSCPDWLVRRWVKQFGETETAAMLEWNTQIPPVYVRLNPLKPLNSVPEDWEALPELPLWFRLRGALPLAALSAGQVYVADPSTRHCIRLLAPQREERILDACAAPGGKSVAIVGATRGDVRLLATDAEEHRLATLRENLQRAGGKDIAVACHDWTRPCPPEWKDAFDAVLLDVPCSNTGVLQRRVDARWRLNKDEMSRLAALQSRILDGAAAAVRAGGRLVYSTCSVDIQEDREQVDAFLSRHPEYRLQEDYLALPHREQADGAYAALLLKRSDD